VSNSQPDLTRDEWTTLRDLLSRAAIRREAADADAEYRSTVDLSISNVEHFIACELAHANGETCPMHKAVQP